MRKSPKRSGKASLPAEPPARLPHRHQLPHLLLGHAPDVAQADAHAALAGDLTRRFALVDVRGEHLDSSPLRLVDERVGRIEQIADLGERKPRIVHQQQP